MAIGGPHDEVLLNLFYKIRSGTMSLDKDKYLTLTFNLRYASASNDSQNKRCMTYSGALKKKDYSIVLQWSHLWSLKNSRLLFNSLV